VRALRDRSTREREGVLYVEGIRQVLAAYEGGHTLDAVLVDPSRMRSTFGWELIDRIQHTDVSIVMLSPSEFEGISSRDNPIGLAALVQWRSRPLNDAHVGRADLWLLADDIRDPGNLGTLIRTVDALGAAGIVSHHGVDAGHPTVARASLGTLFRTRVHHTASLDELFAWTSDNRLPVVATSTRAEMDIADLSAPRPLAVLVGNEGEGLDVDTIARCEFAARIPMHGSASSLNVSVAAGIALYELMRGGR
jgi:TrmH family RNA methyltransferase